VLAVAPTGTGKTAAFAIPIIELIDREKRSGHSECLVLVPTRELAVQIEGVFNTLAKHLRVRALSIYGGVEQDHQIEQLKKNPEIIISTPGRMFDLIHQGYLKLERIQFLVLDEADKMLGEGFIKDIKDLLYKIPGKRQTLLFSATINPAIKKLSYQVVRNPVHIQIAPGNPISKNIEHHVAFIKQDDKRFFLERLFLENPERRFMVFVRTRVRADRVCAAMNRSGIHPSVIHGDVDQHGREAVLKSFRAGTVNMLIATDVSARGIDVPAVDYVVNYDIPDQAEAYVHRVGRTGRGNKKGLAISFCSEEEKTLLADIESYIQIPIDVIPIQGDVYRETLDFTRDTAQWDWKKLMASDREPKIKKKKSKR
jgi:ATP-dependent RNA helicase RhlE